MSTHRDRIEAQFTRQAEAYAQNAVVADERLHGFLVTASEVRPDDRVLDVACGPGLLTLALATRAATAVGFDVTERFLRAAAGEARRRGLAARFVRGDVSDLPFPDSALDVVTCKFAFHHFPDPERVLREMVRVVRPGGRLAIVDMIGDEHPSRRAEHDRIETLCDPTHAGALPASAFEAMFASSGLEVVLARRGESRETLAAWLGHAGPAGENAREITAWAERHAGSDGAGTFRVYRADGELLVGHTGASWILRRPPAAA